MNFFLDIFSSILCWNRYINDVIMMWTGGVPLLKKFIQKIGINDYNLKFTMLYDEKRVPFLDFFGLKRTKRKVSPLLYIGKAQPATPFSVRKVSILSPQ